MGQPIIRGIQAVGSVGINYRYMGPNGEMTIPQGLIRVSGKSGSTSTVLEKIVTGDDGVEVAGFRLDGEFLRANPQIASSIVIPLLGGGGQALTNNNRTGTLVVNCTKVSIPAADNGAMLSKDNVGPISVKDGSNEPKIYDLVFLAQVQQAQVGGDSYGATITVSFDFAGITTSIAFQGCTVASVDPVGLSGNDLVNYNVSFNYLNWVVTVNNSESNTADNDTTTPATGSGNADDNTNTGS